MPAHVTSGRVDVAVNMNHFVGRYSGLFFETIQILCVNSMKFVLVIEQLLKVVARCWLVFVTLGHILFNELVERLRIFLKTKEIFRVSDSLDASKNNSILP